jgi:hypothetical protein
LAEGEFHQIAAMPTLQEVYLAGDKTFEDVGGPPAPSPTMYEWKR